MNSSQPKQNFLGKLNTFLNESAFPSIHFVQQFSKFSPNNTIFSSRENSPLFQWWLPHSTQIFYHWAVSSNVEINNSRNIWNFASATAYAVRWCVVLMQKHCFSQMRPLLLEIGVEPIQQLCIIYAHDCFALYRLLSMRTTNLSMQLTARRLCYLVLNYSSIIILWILSTTILSLWCALSP